MSSGLGDAESATAENPSLDVQSATGSDAVYAHAARAPLLYQRVRIHGLGAKPELNGRYGKAVEFEQETGEYSVVLDGSEEPVAIKAANLTQPVGRSAELTGAMQSAEARMERAPLVGENRGRATTQKAVDSITQQVEASMRAGRTGPRGPDQEIKMLKAALAADPTQPSAWFNLAICYKGKGMRLEGVCAMDRAIVNLIRAAEPGAVKLAGPEDELVLTQQICLFLREGGDLLEEAVRGQSQSHS